MKKLYSIAGIVALVAIAVYGRQQQSGSANPGISFTMGSAGATKARLDFSGGFGSRFSWYAGAVQNRIKANWHQSDVDPARSSAPRVIVTFDILRSGIITNIQITQSSKNYSVDNFALQAVQESSPLMALPAAYGGSRVSAELYVDYKNQIAAQPQRASPTMSPSASGKSLKMALPDCSRKPVVQPKVVTLACADAGFYIENISWTGWGASFAAGYGDGKINDCKPNCAAGHFRAYPMLLIATGSQTCPNGQPAYEKVIYAFIGRSPLPAEAPGTTDPTQEFRCEATP